jgi:hypothetical protein
MIFLHQAAVIFRNKVYSHCLFHRPFFFSYSVLVLLFSSAYCNNKPTGKPIFAVSYDAKCQKIGRKKRYLVSIYLLLQYIYPPA